MFLITFEIKVHTCYFRKKKKLLYYPSWYYMLKVKIEVFERHGIKLGPGIQDPGLQDLGPRDSGLPSKFKSSTWDPPKV